jgi:acetylornithine deacetylase/succinyl-diaminopimelate desuccinylase-like protein
MADLCLDKRGLRDWVENLWEEEIVPELIEYIAIPNKSPLFDPDWAANGHMERAVSQIEAWCKSRPIEGLVVEVIRLEGRTPLIYMEVPGRSDDTVLLYGHLDKQPEMVGWREDLGPWKPVREGEKLYGRGGADDGYSAFASLAAIEGVKRFGGEHARCVVIIEGCEESGSFDLPYYIEHLQERIGDVSLVVCLDSGCGDYERLWSTTSLRGMVAGDLRVDILREGVHSGDASGVVPSSFRILRHLLSRIEDPATGEITLPELHASIPAPRVDQATQAASVLKTDTYAQFPFVEGASTMAASPAEAVINRTWRPTLSVTGASGLPALTDAGNVLRPHSAVKLSFRLPPSTAWEPAAKALKDALEADPPYGAKVSFTAEKGAKGWDAPPLADWLADSVEYASTTYFENSAAYMGEGGTIPFMGMLGDRFPKAQFLITGVLGPQSNAHGPNEFLHLTTGKRITCCVAQVLVDHVTRTA